MRSWKGKSWQLQLESALKHPKRPMSRGLHLMSNIRFPLRSRWLLRVFPLVAIAAATCTLVVAPGEAAEAAPYPTAPLRLIVPFPAGGGADHWGRLLAQYLAEELGQPVNVENIPGVGGNKGTALAARAPADGYTLLLGSVGPLVVHPFTYSKLEFDPAKAFVPI